MKAPLTALLTRAAAASSSVCLRGAVFLTIGTAMKKRTVLMVLMNLLLVHTLSEHAEVVSSSAMVADASQETGSVMAIMTVGT